MKKFFSNKKSAALKVAIAAGICFTNFAQVSAETPSFFDWRLTNPTDSTSGTDELSIVTPVENQGLYGVCWTFGTFGSYESSWMKQLKAAQAAGYNVTPAQVIFSKHYLAWTTFLPTVDALNQPYFAQVFSGYPHPIYDTGAVRKSEVTFATSEQESYVASQMNQDTILAMFKAGVPSYLVTKYYSTLPDSMSDEEKDSLSDAYANSLSLSDEEISAVAEEMIDAAKANAVMNTLAPTGLLHDTYLISDARAGLKETDYAGFTTEKVAALKELISTEGVVFVAHHADQSETYFEDLEVDPTGTVSNHAEALVGWDDNYIFKNYTDSDGNPLRGAFIMRNNWGDSDEDSENYKGYAYLSYQDTSFAAAGFYNAELDSKRYTTYATNAPAFDTIDHYNANDSYATTAIANSHTADSDSGEILKAVTFFASENNMPYEIIVREGSTPGEGTILTQQAGTFGADGSAKWKGFRTVDLDKFVFLAKDNNYVVEVRTTSPTGQPVYVALQAGQDVEMSGKSFVYDEAHGQWIDSKDTHQDDNVDIVPTTANSVQLKISADTGDEEKATGMNTDALDRDDYKRVYAFTAARGKVASEANGADFTLSWLDDTNSSGNSIINLGSATELYDSDAANPDRKTLSNMTVDLSANVYNYYRGSIIGEGSVTKTGAGFLALNGTNTYTGGTLVNNRQIRKLQNML